MRFVKENYKALLLIMFACISEVIVGLFSGYEHSTISGYTYTYGDMLYYFFNQVGYVSLILAFLLYRSCKNIHSRGLYLGLVVWNMLEVAQEVNMLFKLGFDFLDKSGSVKSDFMQILFITFTVVLTYYAYTKCSSLFRSS